MTTLATIRTRVGQALKSRKSYQVDSCDAAWTAGTNVTATADTSVYKEGTASAKLVMAAGATTGVYGYHNIDEVDLSQYGKIVFWIYPTIATITAGQLEIVLCKATAGAGQVENLDVPAMATANVWYRFAVNLADPTLCTNIVCVGLNATADVTACSVYIDDICAEPADYRWPDDILNIHIEKAVEELSMVLPRKRVSILKSVKTCHKVPDETQVIAAASATSWATAYTLLTEIKTDYGTHIASTTYHKAADATNTISAAAATTKATSIILYNELKLDINAHRTLAGVHYADDTTNQITDDDAVTTDTDAELFEKFNNLEDKYTDHLDEEGTGTDVDISSLTSRVRVTSVEYPIGTQEDFEIYGENLTLLTTPPTANDEDIKVYWDALHSLTSSASTLTAQQEDLVVLGACAHALLEYSAYTTNRVNVGDVTNYRTLGTQKLAEFRGLLQFYKQSEPTKTTKISLFDMGM